LPLAIREATKLIPFLEKSRKSYHSTFHLGIETDSYDAEGELRTRFEGELPSVDQIRSAMEAFEGEISQVPPMFSAVKKGGVPLYKFARRGEDVEREPRSVQIERFVLQHFEAPMLEVEVVCSAGTYVRTLAFDLGRTLGCGAHVASIQRTESSPFMLQDAVSIETLERASEKGEVDALLMAPERALGLPIYHLAALEMSRVLNGGEIRVADRTVPAGARYAALGPDGQLCAVLEVRQNRRLVPLRVVRPLAS